MRDFTDTAKALSDVNRVRILLALKGRELCVCQLVELLGLAASTVSRHVSVLRRAGLLEDRKEGRWVHCRRAGRQAPPRARSALRWLDAAMEDDGTVAADARRLEEITRIPVEELCRPNG